MYVIVVVVVLFLFFRLRHVRVTQETDRHDGRTKLVRVSCDLRVIMILIPIVWMWLDWSGMMLLYYF